MRGLAHGSKPLGGLRGAPNYWKGCRPALREYTGIIIVRAGRSPAGAGRQVLGPQRPGRPDAQRSLVLEQVRRLVDLELPPRFASSGTTTPASPNSRWSRIQLQQAFLIVRNAAEAMGIRTASSASRRTAFQITIHGQRYRLAAGIKIIDNGPRIPDAIRDTLFLSL